MGASNGTGAPVTGTNRPREISGGSSVPGARDGSWTTVA
jgi:hypothetical protein